MKRAKCSKSRDRGECDGILKYVRRSIVTEKKDTTGNNNLEYAYFVICFDDKCDNTVGLCSF